MPSPNQIDRFSEKDFRPLKVVHWYLQGDAASIIIPSLISWSVNLKSGLHVASSIGGSRESPGRCQGEPALGLCITDCRPALNAEHSKGILLHAFGTNADAAGRPSPSSHHSRTLGNNHHPNAKRTLAFQCHENLPWLDEECGLLTVVDGQR